MSRKTYADMDASGNKVINVATATIGTDAANKDYADGVVTTHVASADPHTVYGKITVAAARPGSPRVGEIWVPSG